MAKILIVIDIQNYFLGKKTNQLATAYMLVHYQRKLHTPDIKMIKETLVLLKKSKIGNILPQENALESILRPFNFAYRLISRQELIIDWL